MTNRKPLYLTGSLAATLCLAAVLYYFLYVRDGGAALSNQNLYVGMWLALIALAHTKKAHPLVFALSAVPLLVLFLPTNATYLLSTVLVAYYGPGSWFMTRLHQPTGELSSEAFIWVTLTTLALGTLVLFYLIFVAQATIERVGRFLFNQPLSGPVLLGAVLSVILWYWYRKQDGDADA